MKIRSIVPGDKRGEHLLKTQRPISRRFHHFFAKTLTEFHWDHLIDVGANYGEMLVFTDIPKFTKLWAFEPNELVYNCLKKNLSHIKNLETLKYAVGGFVGEVQFKSDETWSGKSHISNYSSDDGTTKKIPIVTLDYYFSDIKDSNLLIKIDVEGYDLEVLYGTYELIKKNKTVFILIENNGWSLIDYKKLLENFKIYLIDSNVKPIIEVPSSINEPFFQSKILFTGNNCLLIPRSQDTDKNQLNKLRPRYRFLLELASNRKFVFLKKLGFYK